jgi:hypothetical protein
MRSTMRSLLIIFAAAAAATSAQAQMQGQAPAGGAGNASPEVRAARMEARSACAADMNTFCSGKTGQERSACMKANSAKLSAPCKAAIAKLPKMQGQAAP